MVGRPILGIGIVLVALTAAAATAAAADATCARKDLKGSWDAYVWSHGRGINEWERCRLRFNNRGGLLSGSSCTNNTNDKTRWRGRLTLSRDCRFSGTVKQTSIERVSCTVRGTLADKEIGSGTGKCRDGSIFIFNLVKP